MQVGSVFPYTCSNWEVISGDDYNHLIVIDQDTDQIYGHPYRQTTCVIRGRFIASFFTQMPTGLLFRLPYKILHLLSGDFICRGAALGTREWEHIQFIDYKNGNNETRYLPPRIALYVLEELIKDIIKIVTYPFALIVMQFITLLGMFDPLDARKYYAALENLYAMGNEEIFPFFQITNFHMPCTQPQEVWESRNFYISFPDYDPESPPSQLLVIRKLIQNDALYFGEYKAAFLEVLDFCKKEKAEYKGNCPISVATVALAKELIINFINDPYQTSPALLLEKFNYTLTSRDYCCSRIHWKRLELIYLIKQHKAYFGEYFEYVLSLLDKFKDKHPLDEQDEYRIDLGYKIMKAHLEMDKDKRGETMPTLIIRFRDELHKNKPKENS